MTMPSAARQARCFGLLAGMLWLLWTAYAFAQDSKSVLVLYGNDSELPWIRIFDASLRSTVTGGTRHHVAFYTEYFDVARFPAPRHQEAFINLVRERYADRKIDVLVSGGATAFDFLVSRRARLFPDPPLVYSFLPPDRAEAPPLPPGVVGVPVDFGPMPTIELALRLHPATKRLVLVTGAGPWDRAWEKRLRKEAASLAGRVELEFLPGLPTAKLLERLNALSTDAVVFTPGYFHDGAGTVFAPREAVKAIAAASAAPVYVAYETQIDTGAVGGVIPTFDAVGRQTGAVVASLLEGKQPAELNLPRVAQGAPLVDWRHIRRWGIDERLLPPDTVVRFREPSMWDNHWREISIGIAVLLLQAALIFALLFERRGRQRTVAALAASERRMDIAARAAKLTTWVWDVARDRLWLAPQSRGRGSPLDDQPLTLESALGKVHPADRERVESAVRLALAANEELDIEYRVVRPDGEVRWIAVRGRAEWGSGQRLVGVAIDVTERKVAELQAERDRTALRHMTRVSILGQLSASIAHQLNQPLAAISPTPRRRGRCSRGSGWTSRSCGRSARIS
jgi:PAS domain-containing protein